MRAINIIIYLLLFTICKSQNLVPNSSFEIYSTCPTGSGQLTNANGWINPTSSGSPDYINTCNPLYQNYINNYQQPKTGNAYSGIAAYESTAMNVREYIQINISANLTPGKCYYVTFYASLMDLCKYACNNLGCFFSNGPVSLSGPTYILNYTAQVKNFNNQIIKNTLNWQKLSGIYVANGGEDYLTIGNFNNDNTTDTVLYNTTVPGTGSYYLIDDISLIPTDSIGGMPASAGPDENITIGDSVFIGQEISNLNCNWYILGGSQIATNASGIYVKPSSPTTFIVEQNLCGTITYDTVFVMVSPTMLKENRAFSDNINVFPNPTTSSFTILNLLESSKLKVDITDTQGKLYSTELITVTNNKATIKINLTNGLYFVSITDTVSGLKTIKKLIVQK